MANSGLAVLRAVWPDPPSQEAADHFREAHANGNIDHFGWVVVGIKRAESAEDELGRRAGTATSVDEEVSGIAGTATQPEETRRSSHQKR